MNRPSCSAALLLTSSCLIAMTWSNNQTYGQEDRRDTREASVDSDDILKRFVDELVRITPGKNDFPESLVVESRELRPAEAFRISCNETTQELYQLVMERNPSRWQGPRNSVESMSKQDAVQFCDRLTRLLRKGGLIEATDVVRLPSDVEWEYCCRAGSREAFCFGQLNDSSKLLDQYAWHTGNAANNDPAVGVLLPNAYGLYDVHGYLWEFVDVNDDVKDAPPVTWVMGGSWREPASLLASDSRQSVPRNYKRDDVGFRGVLASRPLPSKNLTDQ